MQWNDHSKLRDTHALLSASKSAWINYTQEDLHNTIVSSWAKEVGTIIHGFAEDRIKARFKCRKDEARYLSFELSRHGVPDYIINSLDIDSIYENFAVYVNDAIGFRMDPEVILYFSNNAYGTADAISFRGNHLQIHDLKTGTSKVHARQLLIYAAFFCHEYKIKPGEITIELRIYQTGHEVDIYEATADDVLPIMDQIQRCDDYINLLNNFERG